jgi:hypothetical protein
MFSVAEASRRSIEVQAAGTSSGLATKETRFLSTWKSSKPGNVSVSQARRNLRHSASSRGRLKTPIARRDRSTSKTDFELIRIGFRPMLPVRIVLHNSKARATIPCGFSGPDHYILYFCLTLLHVETYPPMQRSRYVRLRTADAEFL